MRNGRAPLESPNPRLERVAEFRLDCATAVAARSTPRQATIAFIEVFVFLLIFILRLLTSLRSRDLVQHHLHTRSSSPTQCLSLV
jgi:hypothetical protein